MTAARMDKSCVFIHETREPCRRVNKADCTGVKQNDLAGQSNLIMILVVAHAIGSLTCYEGAASLVAWLCNRIQSRCPSYAAAT